MSTRRTIDIDIKNNADKTAKDFEDLSKATNKAADSADRLDATFEEVYGELQPLTTRMGEAEDRLYELALAGDTTSKEYQDLLKSVGNYRKVQIQTDLAVDSAATTLGQKLGGALTGATGGFAAIQGVMGLVGSESEQLEAALLKVQSALAIQQGVQGIKEAIPSFKMLGKTAMTALKGIKSGIAATGVGLLVIAVGTLVAYWDDITAAISGVSDEQQALNAETEKNVLAAKENLDTLNGQENILKLQGKSEREILKLKMAATDEMITASMVQIEQMEQTKKAQVEAAQRNKDIAQGIIAFLSAPIVILLGAVDALTSGLSKIGVLSEGTNLAQGFTEGAANLLFDPEETAAEADEEINVAKKALEQLKNNRAGFQLQIKAIDTQAANERLKTEKDTTAKLQKEFEDRLAAEKLILQEGVNFLKNANFEEVESTFNKYAAMGKLSMQYHKEEQERRQRNKDFAVDAAFQTLELVSSITELFGKKGEKQAKKAFQVQKAAQIATTLATTYLSATQAYASQFLPLPDPSSPVRGGIAAGLAVAAGLANVAKIASQKFEGGGSTGSASVSGSIPDSGTQAPQFNVVGDSGVNQLAQLQQQPTQAFVVSGEVTTAQALDRNRVQNATL